MTGGGGVRGGGEPTAIMNSQHLVMNRGKAHGPTPPGDPLATDDAGGGETLIFNSVSHWYVLYALCAAPHP